MKKTTKKKYVKVTMTMSDETLLSLALMAHERDITLNALVNLLLESAMKKRE